MTYYRDTAAEAERAIMRATALTIECPYCRVGAGYMCVDRTGRELHYQAAHSIRLLDSGAA